MSDLSNYRKSYEKSALLETNVPNDPMNLFHSWFYELEEFGGTDEPNAMSISTIGLDGFPKTRVVLLKKFNEEGFVFYTNYLSEKGQALAQNPNVCLSFFWPSAERQVIVKGTAKTIDAQTSDTYFESRPLGSQLGAVVSPQSQVIASREVLELSLKEAELNAASAGVSRPPHWGGYLVSPISVEFWQGRPNRLHDRLRYTLLPDWSWELVRLAP
ncbi:MAG: pyridoxamine 5'-phosphate oxidase [Flavobacterium sp. BFFFF2]|nr:MAG: pyridoxamine 5'-phosphate oxidase [Flavobacterium sp. BFFFF2]